MLFQSSLILLAASCVEATAVLAQRAPIAQRSVAQGWSLQSSSAPTSLHSCGNGAYCPTSLHCNTAANHEVAACCPSSNDCRGDVEGAPACADSSWSLWIGYDGNGFCCETDLVGVYDITKSVAGTCVASGSKGSLRDATLTSTGTGGAAATSAAVDSSTATSAASTNVVESSASGTSTSSTVVVVPASSTNGASAATTSSSTSGPSTTATSASSTDASVANATSSAAATTSSSSDTSGASAQTTAGFSLMAVAFIALTLL